MFSLKKTGQSAESYYSKIVGKRNFDKVFQRVFNAVPCQRANDFPADMLFKKRPRRKDIMKSFTLAGGIQSITDAIASQQSIEILTGKEIEDIHFGDDLFQITAIDRSIYKSRMLALATPASVAAQLLETPFPEISQQISQIKIATVKSIGVAIRKDSLSLEPVAGIIPTDDSFYSVVSRDTVQDNNYRGFTFHFKPGLMDLESRLKRIGKVLGVQRDQLVYVTTKENILPSLKVGYDKLVNTIDRLIAGKPLLLTGNYFSGVAIEDCVSRSLREFGRMKNAEVGSYLS
jgi:protoporphyrinogen oxidase